ncbi:MAG: DUF2461 domain-containing protein [Bacteroidales bacterium]|nr:DUF2461 domain-containing protein [Bacteroidales bacterium]
MKLVYDFLKQLCINNNRDWFTANKDFFEQAKLEFKDFVEKLIPQIVAFDDTVKDVKSTECIFRIYKDVRFSKDKTPYKTNMGAFITPEGRKSCNAGYYIHIEPDNSFTAGGIYMPPSDKLLKIRQSIYSNPSEFKKYYY